MKSKAILVALGIMLSRIFGLVRDRVFGHYLGASVEAGVFRAALRIPNILQNLFGEGVLSASFIPVYANLRARGDHENAEKLALEVFGLLIILVTVLTGLGVLGAEWMVGALVPGFDASQKDLTIRLVRLMFPGTGALVLSAWCLGVLNSHGKFFLSYAAPVIWNVAMIVALLIVEIWPEAATAVDRVTYGALIGSLLQFAIQLPSVYSLLKTLTPNRPTRSVELISVVRNFLPVVTSRGVVQVSAYLDGIWSSFLGPALVAGIAYAQQLYLLPVSLFGMAISASELPELSKVTGTHEERNAILRLKMRANCQRLGFFIIPSTVALIMLGKPIVQLIYQTGKFGGNEVEMVSYLCAISALGLLANTRGRLFATAFYALSQGKVPLRTALLRLLVGGVLGGVIVMWVKSKWELSELSAGGLLTAVSTLAAWLEYLRLRTKLIEVIGAFYPRKERWLYDFKMIAICIVSGIFAQEIYESLLSEVKVWGELCVCGIYGSSVILSAAVLKIEEAEKILSTVTRRLGLRKVT